MSKLRLQLSKAVVKCNVKGVVKCSFLPSNGTQRCRIAFIVTCHCNIVTPTKGCLCNKPPCKLRSDCHSKSDSVHRSFVLRSFVRSFIHSFHRSFVRSFVRSFLRSFVRSFGRSFVRSFVRTTKLRHPLPFSGRVHSPAGANAKPLESERLPKKKNSWFGA